MKFVKPIILILVIIASAIFFADKTGRFNKDACALGQVQKNVTAAYNDLDNTSEGQALIAKVDVSIDEGYIDLENKEKILKANLEMSYRTKNACEISDDLKFDATETYAMESIGLQCPKGQFTAQAKSEYEDIKNDENDKYFQEKALMDVTPQISNDQAREGFVTQWQDNTDFRDIVILALLEKGLRQKKGCADINLPMIKLNQEIQKYIKAESQ